MLYRLIVPGACLLLGLVVGMQLSSQSDTDHLDREMGKEKIKKRVKQPTGVLGLEGIYAEIKEPLLLNKDIHPVQKAVMLHDIETREIYRQIIDDLDSGMEVELSIQSPYSRRVLEAYLQENGDDVQARALLIKYLVYASYKGRGEFEESDLKRALIEARILSKVKTKEMRAEMQRLNVELDGFLTSCPSHYALTLKSHLQQIADQKF